MHNGRMPDPIDIPGLARELGVRGVDVLACARRIGLPVQRMAARLTTAQANRLREERKSGGMQRHRNRPIIASPSPQPTWSTCVCCKFKFIHGSDETPEFCDNCRDHYCQEREAATRTIVRLTEHEHRLRERVAAVSQKVGEYDIRMRSALGSRDKWKRALVEVILAHEPLDDGGCCCGAERFPCVTRRQLEDSNRGIARQVETLEGMSLEELEKFLYGDDSAIAKWE